MKEEFIVTYITTPDEETARKIAVDLLEKKIAACINITPNIYSIYLWKGDIEDGRETLMTIKTRRTLFKELIRIIKKLHPYEVPEIIALPIIEGYKPYLDWIRDETRNEKT